MEIESSNQTVIHRFLESEKRFPDKPAIWARDQHLTFVELSRLAESIRRSLAEAGLQGPKRIGVITGDGAATYASILAIISNGGTYVPINNKNPVQRNLTVVDQAGIAGLVYEESNSAQAEMAHELAVDCEAVPVKTEPEPNSTSLRANGVDESSPAYLLFTSGSTGKPKGVPISHENLANFLGFMLDGSLYSFSPDDKFLQMFELTFDLSDMSFFVPLSVGACCYVVPESAFGAATILKVLQDYELTVALMVPSMLVFLEPYLETRVRLPNLRYSLFCGEALPDTLAQKWHLAAPESEIENLYGPTEATIFCLRYVWDPTKSPAEAVNGVVPIGKPLPGTQIVIAGDSAASRSATGAKGELLLCGAQLASGYWRDEEKTRAAFVSVSGANGERRAYRTGDVCSLNANGDCIYHGRLDSQVKIDGHRVELGEVEHHVREILARTNIAVIAASREGRAFLALFIEEPSIDQDSLMDRLRERVPEYMVPNRLEYVKNLPLNLNGKVDRPKLRQQLENTASLR